MISISTILVISVAFASLTPATEISKLFEHLKDVQQIPFTNQKRTMSVTCSGA